MIKATLGVITILVGTALCDVGEQADASGCGLMEVQAVCCGATPLRAGQARRMCRRAERQERRELRREQRQSRRAARRCSPATTCSSVTYAPATTCSPKGGGVSVVVEPSGTVAPRVDVKVGTP